jgi:hypothetical protein
VYCKRLEGGVALADVAENGIEFSPAHQGFRRS